MVEKKGGKLACCHPFDPFYSTQPSDQATSKQNNACRCLDIKGGGGKKRGAEALNHTEGKRGGNRVHRRFESLLGPSEHRGVQEDNRHSRLP